MTKIFLKRGKEESLGRRHPWVFSGAIERMEGEPAEGDVVDVYSRQGEFPCQGPLSDRFHHGADTDFRAGGD